MIGEKLILIEEFEFNGKIYKKGHQFTIINSSIRGYDIEDSSGNKIYETGLIRDKFEFLWKLREDKLKDLGIN